MKNVLIFQPYLSNRKLSSGTIERQCRFLKYEKDTKVYALFDASEKDYAKLGLNGKVIGIFMQIL